MENIADRLKYLLDALDLPVFALFPCCAVYARPPQIHRVEYVAVIVTYFVLDLGRQPQHLD